MPWCHRSDGVSVKISSARDLLESYYGSRLVSNLQEHDYTVGTSAVRIAVQDPAVTERIITNNGSASIFVSSLPGVAVNAGIVVGPGASINPEVLTDRDLAFCDLWAISGSAGNAVHVISTQLIGE